MNGYCMVSCALLGSTIMTMMMNKKYMNEFEDSLDKSQKEIYNEIRKERLQIFMIATFISIPIGIWITYKNVCLGTATALFLQMMIYLIWPKSKYMLEYLKEPKQSALWIKMYKYMSLLGYIGTIFGVMIYVFYFTNKTNKLIF